MPGKARIKIDGDRKEEIAARLRILWKGLSGKAIVEKLEWLVSLPSVSEYKTGKITPGPEVLIQIAEAFDTTVDWILRGDETPAPKTAREAEALTEFRELEALGKGDAALSYMKFVHTQSEPSAYPPGTITQNCTQASPQAHAGHQEQQGFKKGKGKK